MKSALFLALALALPSTAAMASDGNQKTELRAAIAKQFERKAGCSGCACCDFIVIGGLKIPVGFPVPTGLSRRD